MEQHIESKTAQTILQKPITIEAGGTTYEVAPPSIATLILVSEQIATLPERRLSEDRVMEDTLNIAKDCKAIGNIAAILILGAKGCRPQKRNVPRKKIARLLGGFFGFKKNAQKTINPQEELANRLLEDLTPRELQNLVARILQQMQIGDFFGLTTFLLEVNLTRATKVD